MKPCCACGGKGLLPSGFYRLMAGELVTLVMDKLGDICRNCVGSGKVAA